MAYNGSGVFQRLYTWTQDAMNNIKIRADRMDSEFDGIADALSLCITKDGQQLPTANLPMNAYGFTGVRDAAARDEFVAAGQVQDQSLTYCGTVGGTANAIQLAPTVPITELTAGQRFQFLALATNTDIVTASVSGQDATPVNANTPSGLQPLRAGQVVAGCAYEVEYDGMGYILLHAGGIQKVVRQYFGSTATYTPTPGMAYAIVELIGGGGGGGGATGGPPPSSSAGAGGGGGGYAVKLLTAADIGASQPITIGLGGISGGPPLAGGNGGTTSFGSIFSAGFGFGGGASGASSEPNRGTGTPGGGGNGVGGDLNVPGAPGDYGVNFGNVSSAVSGIGGSSPYLSGFAGGVIEGSGGRSGVGYGGGGSGGSAGNASTGGGVGGAGVCIVTEYCS